MNHKQLGLLLGFLGILILTACGGQSAENVRPMPAMDEAVYEEAIAYDEAESMAFAPPTENRAADQSQQERLIIRTADMSIVVTDTDQAMADIANMATSNGGWVVNSGVYEAGEEYKAGNITIRVPSEGFQSALDTIDAMAVKVTNLSTSGQDVTEEYVDLTAQLENLEATAERVRSFLDETENVEEALAVNQELSRLEGEIERIKGRMKYLSQSASFSTISINLTPDALAQPIQVAGWEPQGVAKSAIEALISAAQAVVNILIWLVIFFLPLALLIGIPLWLIWRFISKRRKQTSAETPPASVSENNSPTE